MIRTLSIYLISTSVALICTGQALSDSATAALDSIHGQAIHGHMSFLADDLLEGRDTGSRGHELAALYVASRFRAAGIEPGGTDGYMQRIRFARGTSLPGSKVRLQKGSESIDLKLEADFLMSPDPVHDHVDVEAELVYAGFGITAPELGYDDYRGLDVRGKIVVLFNNAPSHFPNDQRAHYANRVTKAANAEKRGAVGMIAISLRTEEQRQPWERAIRNAGPDQIGWVEADGNVKNSFPGIASRLRFSPTTSARLFKLAGLSFETILKDAEKGTPKPRRLGVTAHIEASNRIDELTSPNVVGVIRGSDPSLRDEYVVYLAHLDHKGIGKPVKGDSIYNGALDNASGVAMMLEVASALASLPRAPSRSIIFVAVTGEERGLLGADYFANHPSVGTVDQFAAVLSVDMQLMLFPLHDIVAFGAEHSTLGATAQHAAERLGFKLSPDFSPAETLFVRTDHYPFVKKGVPALFLVQGLETGDKEIDGQKIFQEWIRNIYHSPQDDLSQTLDFGAAEEFAKINFLIGYDVATNAKRPVWNRGDFFGNLFGSRPVASGE